MTPKVNAGKTLFVLAHPDDEVLFWPLIARTPGDQLALLFVTDGSADGKFSPEVRANETTRALAKLGIGAVSTTFMGRDKRLHDGRLYAQMDEAWSSLVAATDVLGAIASIVTHAWEGGHQDHDVSHALALALARRVAPERVSQVACYRRPDAGLAPYSLLDPIAANGTPSFLSMTGAERRAMALSVTRYPSQWKSWVGLGPPLVTRLAVSSAYPVQAVSDNRLSARPHQGRLLYEARGSLSFDTVSAAISSFLRQVG